MPVKTSTISFSPTCLPVSKGFQKCLAQALNQHDEDLGRHVTLNFRDKSYSAANGGFHPVEIALQKIKDAHYSILYITDFSYCGGPYPELERDVDFDIGNGMAFSCYGGWQSIREPLMAELYELWQSNFVAYVDMDAYDEIKVSSH
ncbi:hypothetical protein VTH8203_02736 [Vibrio thalassae]|uniref:DUF2787 domain-containing protein n=1 Tax=Vibrio thalassae TaxID=1243014 RepID=A0A240ELS1_9VIBR|nr:DUF2787 domain-containing protein [Vibrio thalassae]SNX49099.1 hypothetical protein VTH8203_02736 [Vibrio thalassae]